MQEFLQALLQFPTLLFAGLLVISLMYWVLVIVGAADLNPFDGAEGLEGAMAGADGAAHGVADGIAEGLAGGAADGLAEGVGEGVADGVGDAASHSVADAVKAAPFTEALAFLGLSKVPITVSFSLFSLFSWFISMVTRQTLDPHLPGALSALAATGAAVVGGVVATSLVTKPIAGIFAESTRTSGNKSLIGRVAKVMTEVADHSRGQGEIDDGAGGIVIQLRTAPGVVLKRGDEVILIEQDEAAGTWLVELQPTLTQTDEEALRAPIPAGTARPGAVAVRQVVDEPVEEPAVKGR